MTARSIAEAWDQDAAMRGWTKTTTGYTFAQDLFYSGAAAMLAMITETGPDRHALLGLFADVKNELEEFLDSDQP